MVNVELTADEVNVVLSLVRARHAEVQRMIQNMEEGEGMDSVRHNALRTMRPQAEALEDLLLKLEGAAQDAKTGR